MLHEALHSPPLEHLHPKMESVSSPIIDVGVLDFCNETAPELFSDPLCIPKAESADVASSATASCVGSSSSSAAACCNTFYSCNDDGDQSFASGFMDAFFDGHSMPSYPLTPSDAAMTQIRSLPPMAVYDNDGFAPPLPDYMAGMEMETMAGQQQHCSYLDSAVFFPDDTTAAMGCGDMPGIFTGHAAGMMMKQEMSAPDMLEGLQGMFEPDSINQMYNVGDIQIMGDHRHHVAGAALLHGGGTDVSGLEDPSRFKAVGRRLSEEERKERIHRYKKKRDKRNFSKKIKYACRKTLADSRPRVRGRFAKNDELGGGETAARPINSGDGHHNDGGVVMKVEEEEEEDMMLGASSDILAYITGVNSFEFEFTIEPWMPTPMSYSQ